METTRRDILKLGAAGGAALVLGVRLGDVDAAPAQTALAPSVWVRIERSGRTVIVVGKSEMGQGVRTSLPMILADELDADWSRVALEQALPGPKFQRLGTGGSWSVGGSWEPLRRAGAAAREMLVAAAAQRWGVDAAALRTERGQVLHPSGKSLAYGDLVVAAAKLPVPESPRLKTAAERRLLGTRMKRLDGPAIVSGAARYGIDVKLPRMVYASIARCPVLGGKLVSVDAAAARAVRGVRDVVTIPTGVAVVADSTWAAMQGREALEVTWDEGPNRAFSSAEHARRLEGATAEEGVIMRAEGTMPAARPGARVVEARYHYPFAAHAPVEPMNCVAHVRGGRAEIWAPTQSPNRVQKGVAETLGIPDDKVEVHVTLMGGGFGRRLAGDYAREAAALAAKLSAPVQVLWTREDDMQHGHIQAASLHQMWGVVENGRAVAWRHKKISTPHNVNGPPSAEDLKDLPAYYRGSSWGVYDVPYAIPAISTSYVKVDAPVTIGPWRAVFAPSSVFARECFIDELAHAAGQDPLAFRLAHLPEDGITLFGDMRIDRRKLRRVLSLAADKAGWNTPPPAGRSRGLACSIYEGETAVAYVAEVSVPGARGGRMPFVVHRMVCAVDCGVIVNPLGIEQQVESGVVWSLSNMKGELTFDRGRVVQSSYGDFAVLRMSEAPLVETHLVPSHGEQPTGIGEPTVPPVAPAVANALFAATGKRVRALPVKLG